MTVILKIKYIKWNIPSMIGTFAADMIFLDVLLIPMSLIAVAGGPTKMRPSFAQSSENSTFSDKKPYPGWIAWQPVCLAT